MGNNNKNDGKLHKQLPFTTEAYKALEYSVRELKAQNEGLKRSNASLKGRCTKLDSKIAEREQENEAHLNKMGKMVEEIQNLNHILGLVQKRAEEAEKTIAYFSALPWYKRIFVSL